VAEDRADEIGGGGMLVFDERNGARDGARVGREHALGERGGGGRHRASSCLAMTSR
jgi:hypothetical protein